MVNGQEQINLIFDLMIPFTYTPEEAKKVVHQVESLMKEVDSRYQCVITVDNKVFGEREAVSNATLAGQVAVSCASGGKPDHLLGVFGTLAENADLSPVLIEDNFECHILSPGGTKDWEIASTYAGSTFSLFALAPDTYVSEQGMEWDLERRYIPVLSDLGVSNVIGPDGARCTCHSGVAAAFLR